MKLNLNTIQTALTVSLLAGVLLVGCEDTKYPDPTPGTAAALNTARTLFVNASNAAGLTALIENLPAGSALAPGANTGYQPTTVGSSQIRVRGAGGTLGTTDLSLKQTFNPATNYTVFVTDTIARPRVVNAVTGATTDAGGIRFLTVTDVLTTPAAGNAGIRFFHLAADVGVVSVRLLPSSGTATAPTFVNRAYRVTTVTSGTVTTNYAAFTGVPAGTYTAQVYSGTAVPASTTVTPALSVSGLTLADGKLYTVFARGLARDRTLGAGVVLHN
jgi:hypothetical protein